MKNSKALKRMIHMVFKKSPPGHYRYRHYPGLYPCALCTIIFSFFITFTTILILVQRLIYIKFPALQKCLHFTTFNHLFSIYKIIKR